MHAKSSKGPPHPVVGLFARNLQKLMEVYEETPAAMAKRTGVSKRELHYIAEGGRTPSIEIAAKIAEGYGLGPWELLVEELTDRLIRRRGLRRLVAAYSQASDKGREVIEHVAESEASRPAK